jgi:hypothetical protein
MQNQFNWNLYSLFQSILNLKKSQAYKKQISAELILYENISKTFFSKQDQFD